VISVVVVFDGCATRLIGRPAQGPPPVTKEWVTVALRQPSNVLESSGQWKASRYNFRPFWLLALVLSVVVGAGVLW